MLFNCFRTQTFFKRKLGSDEKKDQGHRARAINTLIPSILLRGRENQTKSNDVRITNSGVHTRRTFYNAPLTSLLYLLSVIHFIKMLHFVKALARPRVAETVERQTFDKDNQPFF